MGPIALSLCLAVLQAAEPPRLTVLLSVDQMRPDQLERLAPALDGGLARMLREGVVFRSATLDYAGTETGPGHATFGTGCLPRTHGIVGNDVWLGSEARPAYCVEERSAELVASRGVVDVKPEHGRGPAHLRVPTLAERVRAAYPAARTVSVSAKDRSAIGMVGRAGDAVLWWDRGDGGFVTSTAYTRALPEWIDVWNRGWVERCSGWRWEPLRDAGLAALGSAPDERPGEAVFGPFGRTFPYQLFTVEDPADRDQLARLAALVYSSARIDELVAEVGLAALTALQLGADDVPDVLALSFSATDTVGHPNGPFSREVTDVILRLDRDLGRLFDELDARVGRGRWVAALTADHGVLPLPEHLVDGFVGARRVGAGELRATRTAVRAALTAEYGEHFELRFDAEGVALDRARMGELGVDPAAARLRARDAALASIGAGSWLGGAYTLDELAAPAAHPTEDPWRALFVNSFDPERSLDVVFRNAPWTLVGNATGTSHGSCYPYDREVPLLFLGAGLTHAVRSDRAGSHDVVPTLLPLLGLPPTPPLDGRDLFQAD